MDRWWRGGEGEGEGRRPTSMTWSCKWLEMMETMRTDLELVSVYVI